MISGKSFAHWAKFRAIAALGLLVLAAVGLSGQAAEGQDWPGDLSGLTVDLSFGNYSMEKRPGVPVRANLSVSDGLGGPNAINYLGSWSVLGNVGLEEGIIAPAFALGNRTTIGIDLDGVELTVGTLTVAIWVYTTRGDSGFGTASVALFDSRLSFGTFLLDLAVEGEGAVDPEGTFVTAHASLPTGGDLANATVFYFALPGFILPPYGFTDGDGRERVLFVPEECLSTFAIVVAIASSSSAGVAIGVTVLDLGTPRCRQRNVQSQVHILKEAKENGTDYHAVLELRLLFLFPPPEPFLERHNTSLVVMPSEGRVGGLRYSGNGTWQMDYVHQKRPAGKVEFFGYGHLGGFPFAVRMNHDFSKDQPPQGGVPVSDRILTILTLAFLVVIMCVLAADVYLRWNANPPQGAGSTNHAEPLPTLPTRSRR